MLTSSKCSKENPRKLFSFLFSVIFFVIFNHYCILHALLSFVPCRVTPLSEGYCRIRHILLSLVQDSNLQPTNPKTNSLTTAVPKTNLFDRAHKSVYQHTSVKLPVLKSQQADLTHIHREIIQITEATISTVTLHYLLYTETYNCAQPVGSHSNSIH